MSGLFTHAVKEFFSSCKLLKETNHTIISLILKSKHCSSVNDFRPISYCTVFYKVISKIITSRLLAVLDTLIDPAQAAFMGSRSITDNMFLAQEIIRQYAGKMISPWCTLKVDMRKAYDSVYWEFLWAVLRYLGFPDLFIAWVMECVSTTSFSLAINEYFHGFIKGRRGLRQGDPMSPSLFLMCMEYFSRLLKSKMTYSPFNFHLKC